MSLMPPPTPLADLHEKICATADRPLDRAVTFPPKAYTDPAHYEFEVDRILKREWLSVGHVSQIPNAGDFFNLDLLGEPMVVVRGKDDEVRVLSRSGDWPKLPTEMERRKGR